MEYFDNVHSVDEDKKNGIIFSHYPIHPSQLEFRYGVNVHGHTHSNLVQDSRYVNVCVENINLTPISREELLKKVEKVKR
jgi:calcineurin-like phosphoesterase family protein